MLGFSVKPGTRDDLPFLETMLSYAADWREETPRAVEAFADDRVFQRYIEGWSRIGDTAVLAEDADGARLGAAWYRLFSPDEPGYGFVASDIPELSLAVERRVRRHGVGAALLEALVERARTDGYRALSLSVEHGNEARRLYDRAGFVVHQVSGGSTTMTLDLAPRPD